MFIIDKYYTLKYLISYFQNEAGSNYLNALMVYIIVCMTFVSIAMLYYGILLYLLRKTSVEITKKSLKITKKVGPMDTNEDEMFNLECDLVIKWDRKMFLFYGIGFFLFNIGYFGYYKILLA